MFVRAFVFEAKSTVEALMNKPSVWILGQYRANGRRERSVKVYDDGSEGREVGSQERMSDSRDGQLVASSMILSLVMSSGWS